MADYTDDVTSGMTFSASVYYVHNAEEAFDDNSNTYWNSGTIAEGVAGHWIRVDFGSGNNKTIEKITIQNYANRGFNSFKLQGSNNDSDWTDIYSGAAASDESVTTFVFSNNTEYRYYRVYCVTSYGASDIITREIEMMERIYFPLTITLSESLEYNIIIVESLSASYGLVPSETLVPSATLTPSNGVTISETITESTEYNITITTTGGS